MKRFMFLFAMLIAVALSVSSCKNIQPDFKFSLNVSGTVCDESIPVFSELNNVVTNVDATITEFDEFFSNYDANSEIIGTPSGPLMTMFVDKYDCLSNLNDINSKDGEQALNWLNNYIEVNVLSEMKPTTKYDILIEGYIHETKTGLSFAVKKRFADSMH